MEVICPWYAYQEGFNSEWAIKLVSELKKIT